MDLRRRASMGWLLSAPEGARFLLMLSAFTLVSVIFALFRNGCLGDWLWFCRHKQSRRWTENLLHCCVSVIIDISLFGCGDMFQYVFGTHLYRKILIHQFQWSASSVCPSKGFPQYLLELPCSKTFGQQRGRVGLLDQTACWLDRQDSDSAGCVEWE